MTNRDKDVEILALRHQLAVLHRQLGGQRPRLWPEDRALLAALLVPVSSASLRRLRLLVSHSDQVNRLLFTPDGTWLASGSKDGNFLMGVGDRASEFRFLVRDRAGQFTASFVFVLADAGINVVKFPPRCPRANCYAERFVATVRRELTDRLLIINERHLESVLNRYVSHYNQRRPRRALHHSPPRLDHPIGDPGCRSVRRRRVLGGLINEYEPAAA